MVPVERDDIYSEVYDADRYLPIVSWSPDGEWLVYHVPNESLKASEDGPYYSIFKVNVETGEPVKLLDNGLLHYWIWPAEE